VRTEYGAVPHAGCPERLEADAAARAQTAEAPEAPGEQLAVAVPLVDRHDERSVSDGPGEGECGRGIGERLDRRDRR
jgi:hypothetical protein